MKIYISDAVLREISTAPEGAILHGTIDQLHGIATVSGVQKPGEPGFPSGTRFPLASVGNVLDHLPLRISPGDGVSVTDCKGNPMEVVAFETRDFFKRTPFDTTVMAHLRSERLLVVGTGSVGAPMSLALAKVGIGGLVLVDKDALEVHNCMRHVLGSAYVGWPKPVALARHIEEQAPSCKCVPVFEDLFCGDRARLRAVIEETRPTRILAVTDVLRIQYLCQRAALYYKLPLMTVWCDNNAVEGEIFMWEPGQAKDWRPGRPERGCYGCMRDPNAPTITRSSSFDYSSDDPDSYGGEPALGTFIDRVNNIATIFMTAWMLRDCPTRTALAGILDEYYDGKGLQYIRLGGPYPFAVEGQITAKKPWAVEWYRVLRRDNCPICGDARRNGDVLFPPRIEAGTNNWEEFAEVNHEEVLDA